MNDTTTRVPVETLHAGDVILPPARELRLWMRRHIAERGLPETALHLTVEQVIEGAPDVRGRWIIVRCRYSPEWGADRAPFSFKARPGTPWPKAVGKEAAV